MYLIGNMQLLAVFSLSSLVLSLFFYRHLYQFNSNYMYLASGLCFSEMRRHKRSVRLTCLFKMLQVYFLVYIFFRRAQQAFLSWTGLPLTAIVQLPGCSTLQKSCYKEKSEAADWPVETHGGGRGDVLPGMRSEVAQQVWCGCQVKHHLPAPGPQRQHRAGDAFRQFYFHRTIRQETLTHHREQEYHNYTIMW